MYLAKKIDPKFSDRIGVDRLLVTGDTARAASDGSGDETAHPGNSGDGGLRLADLRSAFAATYGFMSLTNAWVCR